MYGLLKTLQNSECIYLLIDLSIYSFIYSNESSYKTAKKNSMLNYGKKYRIYDYLFLLLLMAAVVVVVLVVEVVEF